MARPIVALLTDFGTRDHYVAAMKGVVLDLCADVSLVDLTHHIPPHDIELAAVELGACYRYFPAGTIFVAVVDPGVGSGRRGLAAEAGGMRFVAPDNGLLTVVLDEQKPRKVVELSDRRYARPTVSRTFEGRDRFAPAAGWLARGVEVGALGRSVSDWQRLELLEVGMEADRMRGRVVRVDRFGNLVTNIDRKAFERFRHDHAIQISIGGHIVDRLVATYAEAPPEDVVALFGSTDHLELAVSGASAAARLDCGRGAPVHVDRSTAV